MPLGAEDVETAQRLDLLLLGLDGGLGLLQRIRPGGLVLLRGVHRGQAALRELGRGEVLRVAAEHDVGASTGHVGGDGDRALAPGLGDDLRLALVVLGVQDLVLDAALAQLLRQVLGLLHADRADQDRLALLVLLGDVLDHGRELGRLGLVDQVRLVDSRGHPVGRDRDDAELVDLVELRRLGLRGTGHPGELVVQAEEVLQGDGGQGLVLVLDLHPLLGLDRLVHALVVAAAGQDAAGVLVDDEDLALHHDVVLVLLVELLRLDGVVEEAHKRGVRRLVEVVDTEVVLDPGDARLQHADGALLLVDLVVDVDLQPLDQLGEVAVPLGGLVRRTGDDQRRTGLVDQDRVDLVHDREVVPALHELFLRPGHVVAQVVEAELVVGAVGDVAGVLLAPLGRAHVGEDHADLKAEEAVHPAHPLRVTLGEVVVHRDQVHTLAGQGVQVRGERADEGLALAGAHLGDIPVVQGRATHDLDVVVTLAESALGRLANGRERLGEDVIKGLTVREALPVLLGERAQLLVRQVDEVLFDGVDLGGNAVQLTKDLSFAYAQDLVEDGHVGWLLAWAGTGRSVQWRWRHTTASPSYARKRAAWEACQRYPLASPLRVGWSVPSPLYKSDMRILPQRRRTAAPARPLRAHRPGLPSACLTPGVE